MAIPSTICSNGKGKVKRVEQSTESMTTTPTLLVCICLSNIESDVKVLSPKFTQMEVMGGQMVQAPHISVSSPFFGNSKSSYDKEHDTTNQIGYCASAKSI